MHCITVNHIANAGNMVYFANYNLKHKDMKWYIVKFEDQKMAVEGTYNMRAVVSDLNKKGYFVSFRKADDEEVRQILHQKTIEEIDDSYAEHLVNDMLKEIGMR